MDTVFVMLTSFKQWFWAKAVKRKKGRQNVGLGLILDNQTPPRSLRSLLYPLSLLSRPIPLLTSLAEGLDLGEVSGSLPPAKVERPILKDLDIFHDRARQVCAVLEGVGANFL